MENRMSTAKSIDVYSWSNATPWSLARTAIERSPRVFLWGPPGIGKSHLTVVGHRTFHQVTMCEDQTVQELVGHYLPDGQRFRWHDGPVALAMRGGALLVLNEIGRASGAVLDFLLGVLDSREVSAVALPSGEHLRPAPGFTVVATSNSSPEPLDPALRSRFGVEVYLPAPNPALVAAVNREVRGLGDALAASFEDPVRALDPRRVIELARLVKCGVPPRVSAALCFGDRAPDVLAALSARGVILQ
jgi:MoxR-like ATPase